MQQHKFDQINKLYTRRRSQLIMSGKAQRPTSVGYWAMSNPLHLFELFRKIGLEKHKRFIDLGSGDGIAVAVASLFTGATGVEVDAQLHKDAEDIKKRLGLDYELKNNDYLKEDLSQYDVIFINPDNYFYKLEKNLVERFKGTLIITDNIFRPLTLSPEKQVSVRGTGYSIYSL
jgi:protein-L-isoaspartate O-methyltransferase